MPPRHVILFEPDASGHRMVFVRYIVEAMARHGGVRATLLTSPAAAAADWVAAMGSRWPDQLTIRQVDMPTPTGGERLLPGKLRRQFAHSRGLRDAVAAVRDGERADRVFIPFVDDYCLFPFALDRRPFGPLPWGGIAIRPRHHLAQMGATVPPRWEDRIEAAAYRGLLRGRTLERLFSIDPCYPAFAGDPRVRPVCDPADLDTARPTSDRLPVSDDAVVLLAYGHVDRRKAIDRLLGVAADPRMPARLTVALVGAQGGGMAAVLDGPAARTLRAAGRLVEVARRVSDAEEAAAFARADIVWGYYPGNYCSSGAMIRAGASGRPLMATREGLVGLLTARHGSGLTAPEDDDEALLAQLVRLASDPALRQELGRAGARRFAGDTGAAFGDRIVAYLAGGEGGA